MTKIYTPYGYKTPEEVYSMKNNSSYNTTVLDRSLESAKLPLQPAGSAYQPTMAETMAKQSFVTKSPYQVPTKSNVVNNMGTSTAQTDVSKAPIVTPNTSDVNAQIESIKAQIADKQKQVDEMKAAEATAAQQASKSQEKTPWDILQENQTNVLNQVNQSQQNLINQQNAIYEKWGLTPENYQKIQDLTTQIGTYQQQMADLDTREAQAIDNIQNRPGVDLAFASGESARIQRAYAIQKSGIAANASILASTAQALQGNWDNAFKSAQLYVDNATKAQQQYVSDLKWGFEQYKDVISSMTADEQKRINDQLDYAISVLNQESEDKWKKIEADQKQQGLNIDYMKAIQAGGGNVTGAGSLIAQSGLQAAFDSSLQGTPYNSPDREYVAKAVNNLLAVGNTQAAKETILKNAVQGLGSTLYQKYINGGTVIKNLSDIKTELQNYKDASGNTNIFNGALQTVLNKLGTTSDPTLAGIENRIKNTLTQYTNAVSGVQFSDEERKVYQSMFPTGYFGGQKLNLAKIDSIIAQTQSTRDSLEEQALGNTIYNELKGTSTQSSGEDMSQFEK